MRQRLTRDKMAKKNKYSKEKISAIEDIIIQTERGLSCLTNAASKLSKLGNNDLNEVCEKIAEVYDKYCSEIERHKRGSEFLIDKVNEEIEAEKELDKDKETEENKNEQKKEQPEGENLRNKVKIEDHIG